jgi:site-specific DNA-methyltransferase (adenine-specific)
MTYSPTYPAQWTEAERAAAEKALTKEERQTLPQECETPPDFWQAVNAVYEFEVDVCASPHNAKCAMFITDDSLNHPWFLYQDQRAWFNPGFRNVMPWHQKAYEEAQNHPSGLVAVIGLQGASQDWYEFAQTYADEIIDLSPRVQYLCPWPLKQQSNPREACLYIYRRKLVPNRPATRSLWRWA